jgi:tetratricopeptide (TPR) repeat protein
MNTVILQKALNDYVHNPRNPIYNFRMGKAYEELGHNGSGLSYFLRAAEHSTNDLLIYESLLKVALCLERSLNRNHSLQGVLLRAITVLPDRPEAYYLLARNYERDKKWHDAYCFAVIGENLEKKSHMPLMTDVEYPGSYAFTFERAVTAWWIGLYDESMHLFKQLEKRPDLRPDYMAAVKNNLANFLYTWKKEFKYDEMVYDDLRVKFPGAKGIKRNFSQLYQDMFILMMLNGKRKGYYVEIGSNDPYMNNNTYLLANEFEWGGISFDINKDMVEKFNKERGWMGNPCIHADALTVDWDKMLTENRYDYLQLDCEPAVTTFNILKLIPLERVKFAVITFEHDHFVDPNPEVREDSRKYLESFGYRMVVNDIAEDRYGSCEDWWYHPSLIPHHTSELMKCLDFSKVHKAEHYILNK